jgi:hypothetical protein
MLLASAMVFNFSTLTRGNQLEEGTTRLETLMRFARAQAANSGRKVQIVFTSESTNSPTATTGEVRATWEPDPLGQPGCFTDLDEEQWHVQEINDLVQVESVKLLDQTGCAAAATSTGQEISDEDTNSPALKPVAPITFYPDGSSDSAEIVVAARSPEEDQRMTVRLVGLTGSISHQLLLLDPEDAESSPYERVGSNRRDSVTRTVTEPESTSEHLNTRSIPTTSSARPVLEPPRSTVGETNTVDLAE